MKHCAVLAIALVCCAPAFGSPPPRRAFTSQHARDVSYFLRMMKSQCMLTENGKGWICPMPPPGR